ncbi:MAG TPA: FAD-dependent oxidoreductase, partial [Actinomycetota bacterium]|nr:FAD-dependent oxidoreductase [Actinomycetota bacterium]
LVAYDLLAAGSGASRHRRLDQPGARQLAWALGPHVTGAYCYPDARTDDARLVWTIARTAGEMGAVVANHAPVLELLRDTRGRASGAVVSDVETGEPVHVRARVVVNASGVWVDEVRRLEDPAELAGVRPAKGIHLTFPASAIRTTAAMLLPAGDGRYVFVIPWVDSTVIVGTTDDDYTGPLDSPTALPQEVSYLIDTVNSYVDPPVGQQDVLSAWAGLRPLIQKPGRRLKELSRRHSVTIGSAGVVTVAGGKLTTYRTMAAEAVDAAAESAGLGTIRASRTSRIRLSGAGEAVPDERVVAAAAKLGLDSAHQLRLHRRYGTHALDVLDLAEREPELVEPLHPHLPYLLAEAAYAIEFESARRPNDVLGHRLRARITSPDGGRAAAAWVSSRLAMTLAWDERTRAMHMSGYDRLVASERSVRDVLNP